MARRRLLGAMLILAACGIAHAQPAAYPTHAIRMVIPFPTGGTTDIGAEIDRWARVIRESGAKID